MQPTDDHFGEQVAATYDESAAAMFAPSVVDPAVDFLAEAAGAGLALEFGVGTGRIALPLAARGVRVHGIDSAPAMVARLRAKPGGDTVGATVWKGYSDISSHERSDRRHRQRCRPAKRKAGRGNGADSGQARTTPDRVIRHGGHEPGRRDGELRVPRRGRGESRQRQQPIAIRVRFRCVERPHIEHRLLIHRSFLLRAYGPHPRSPVKCAQRARREQRSRPCGIVRI